MRQIMPWVSIAMLAALCGCSGEADKGTAAGGDAQQAESVGDSAEGRFRTTFFAGDNHTNPPIIVGKGSLKWYAAKSEKPNNCGTSPDTCSTGYFCFKEKVKGAMWCVKELKGTYDVFNDDGSCTVDATNFDPWFTAKGTDWALVGKAPGKSVKEKHLKLKGGDYVLEFKVGRGKAKGAKPNEWTLTWKPGATKYECPLTHDGPNLRRGEIPNEFVELLEIGEAQQNKEDPPLGFATCRCSGCEHPPCITGN